MIIYTASYATEADYDCFGDDGRNYYSSMWDMAEGTTACAGTDRDRVIAKVKAIVTQDMIDCEELTPDDELTFEVDADKPNYITAICGVDPVAAIVIREYEEA